MTAHSDTLVSSDEPLSFAAEPVLPPAVRQPTADEQKAMSLAKGRRPKFQPQLRLQRDENGRASFGPPHSDAAGHASVMAVAFGSTSDAFQRTELKRLAACRLSEHNTPDEDEINTAVAIIASADPQNELEAALAVQMAVVHQVGMKAIAKVARTEFDPEQCSAHMRTASKAMRLYSDMLLTLHKIRKKGDQHIRVEHLHLEPGAKAIIANEVAGRGRPDSGGQPDGTP